jgi:quinol monooxygenase YgiN
MSETSTTAAHNVRREADSSHRRPRRTFACGTARRGAKSLNGTRYHFVPGRRRGHGPSRRVRPPLALDKSTNCLDRGRGFPCARPRRYVLQPRERQRVRPRTGAFCASMPRRAGMPVLRDLPIDDPAGRFVSIERYADADAFAAHRASAHFKEIGLGEVMPLVVARDITLYGAPIDVPPVPAQ